MLAVSPSGGPTMYSIAFKDDAVCNVTPLTQLVLNVYFQLLGSTPAQAFNNPAGSALPSRTELAMATELTLRSVRKQLADSGIAFPDFNPFTSAFTANHKGFDAFLDATVFSTNAQGQGVLTSTSNGIQEVSTFVVDTSVTAAPRLTTQTTSTNLATGVSTTCRDTTIVPRARNSSELAAAVEGVNQTLASFSAVVNGRGSALTDQDVLPFLSSTYLDDGLNQAQMAAHVATVWRGLQVNRFQVGRVDAFDASRGLIVVSAFPSLRQGSIDQTENLRMVFKKDATSGNWQRFGNQQIAFVGIDLENVNLISAAGNTVQTRLYASANAPQATVTGVTVSDSLGVFNNAPLTLLPRPLVETLSPTSSTPLQIVRDRFFLSASTSSSPPIDSSFSFLVQPAGGGAASTYTRRTGGVTSEALSMTVLFNNTPVAHNLSDAHLGSSITAQWTLPTTYTVGRVLVSGVVSSKSFVDAVPPTTLVGVGKPGVSPTTTANLTLPATIGNGTTTEAVTGATLRVSIEGLEGERSTVDYIFR